MIVLKLLMTPGIEPEDRIATIMVVSEDGSKRRSLTVPEFKAIERLMDNPVMLACVDQKVPFPRVSCR